MDMSMITQLINSVGFPIVACGAMFWYINRSEERHLEETSSLRESIEQNTAVMNRLLDRIDATYPNYREDENNGK